MARKIHYMLIMDFEHPSLGEDFEEAMNRRQTSAILAEGSEVVVRRGVRL